MSIHGTLSTRDQAWLQATFDRNRALFGQLRMDLPPAPVVPPPPVVAPVPAAVPPAPIPAPDAPVVSPNGYPENTPWRQMEPADQVLYWQHHARTHESALKAERTKNAELTPLADQMRAADEARKSESQREIDRLKAENAALALKQAADRTAFGAQLAEAKLSAAAEAKGKTLAQLKTIAGGLDRFLSDGALNTEAVDSFLAELPDATVKQPGNRNMLGAGRQQSAAVTGLEAGAELFAVRHKKKLPPA